MSAMTMPMGVNASTGVRTAKVRKLGANPVSGDLMTAAYSDNPQNLYSEFTKNLYDRLVVGENPETAGRPHAREAMDTFYLQFADWAMENPAFLTKTSKGYFATYGGMNAFILRYCNYIRTDETRFFRTKIEYKRQMPDIATRKVPGRMISSTISRIEGHTVYTHEGLQGDFYSLRHEMGRRDWDFKLKGIAGDFWAFITFDFINTIIATPQKARTPHELYPNRPVPTRISDVYDREQGTFGRMNKSTGAYWEMVRDANAIFSQYDETMSATEVIMSTSDTYYMFRYNDVNVRVDKSGNGAIEAKRMLTMPNQIGSIKLTSVPFIEPDLHNDFDEQVLNNPIACGSRALFRDLTIFADAKAYQSWMRDIEYVSWKTNTWDRYRYSEFLMNCVEWNPLMRTEGEEASEEYDYDGIYTRVSAKEDEKPGRLNIDLLMKLVRSAREERHIFGVCGMKRDGNEPNLHPLLDPVDPTYATHQDGEAAPPSVAAGARMGRYAWHPTYLVGQLGEGSCQSRHYERFYETMANQLYADLSEAELRAWGDAIKEALDMNDEAAFQTKYTTGGSTFAPEFLSAFEKVLRRMHQCTHDHPLFSDLVDNWDKASNSHYTRITPSAEAKAHQAHFFFRFIHLFILQRRQYSLYDTSVCAKYGIYNHDPTAVEGAKTRGESAEAYLKRKLTEVKEGAYMNKEWDHLPYWFQLMKRFPVATPSKVFGRDGLSMFTYRYLRSFELSPAMFFAAQVFLWQPNTLQGLAKKFYDNNIMIPTGGSNLRPREAQFMRSVIFLALGSAENPEKFADFYHSGFDSFLQWQPNTKDFYMEMEQQHGFMVTDNRRFIVFPFVRGGPIIGGSDNEYADQRVLLGPNADFSTFWRNLEVRGSNLAVLGSYNEAVNGPEEEHVDMHGYHPMNVYRQRLHASPDFSRERETPMFSNVCLFNLIHRFERTPAMMDNAELDKQNFFSYVENFRVNYVCHNTSVRRFDPLAKVFVTDESRHPWGEILPGIRERVQSMEIVTDYEDKTSIEYMRKKVKYTSY